jgi:hypothetical protein
MTTAGAEGLAKIDGLLNWHTGDDHFSFFVAIFVGLVIAEGWQHCHPCACDSLCPMISPRPHTSAPKGASGRDQVSMPLKIAAWLVRGAGFLVGAASVYLFMAWDSPPDMSNARPRTAFNFYLTGPLLLFCGPMLLAGWIAWRIGHRKLMD